MKSRAIQALEREVEERTRQLDLANYAKSRFLSASHDLRQPLHALGLFVAQLRGDEHPAERARIAQQIQAAFSALNQRLGTLFEMASPHAESVDASEKYNTAVTPIPLLDPASGKLILVIDDDPLVLES